jgi:hypothetical protein
VRESAERRPSEGGDEAPIEEDNDYIHIGDTKRSLPTHLGLSGLPVPSPAGTRSVLLARWCWGYLQHTLYSERVPMDRRVLVVGYFESSPPPGFYGGRGETMERIQYGFTLSSADTPTYRTR